MKATKKDSLIYVPSMNLEIARERSHYGLNWKQAHEVLAKEGSRMLSVPEFVNFLNYLKENPSDENTPVYEDITKVRTPWRAEWLDSYFEKREDELYVLTRNKTKAEKLETKTLIDDKTPGISLDCWLHNPTSQGLPKKDIPRGDLYYWHPRDGKAAGFDANSVRSYLFCNWYPLNRDSILGVRAAKQRE